MDNEERRVMEHRLTALEMGIEQVKHNSEERPLAIMSRFDRQDRISNMVISGIFATCLAIGGIYLEAYLNKEEIITKPVVAVLDADGV
jgi:hypothetical protein